MGQSKITIEDLRPYFEDLKRSGEKEISYYERTLPQHVEIPEKWIISWNWPAACFPTLWMLYRKMYWQAATLILAGGILENALEEFAQDSPILIRILRVLGFLLFGGFGNALYYRDLKNRIKKGHVRKGVNVPIIFLPIILFFGLIAFGPLITPYLESIFPTLSSITP